MLRGHVLLGEARLDHGAFTWRGVLPPDVPAGRHFLYAAPPGSLGGWGWLPFIVLNPQISREEAMAAAKKVAEGLWDKATSVTASLISGAELRGLRDIPLSLDQDNDPFWVVTLGGLQLPPAYGSGPAEGETPAPRTPLHGHTELSVVVDGLTGKALTMYSQ